MHPRTVQLQLVAVQVRRLPGKLSHHRYRLWYERVTPQPGQKPMSKCYSCEEKEKARQERLKAKLEEVKGRGVEGISRLLKEMSLKKDAVNDVDLIPIAVLKEAVPRGQEEGIFICYFICTCLREYTVKCEMQDTAECYKCRRKDVPPCHFEPRLQIHKTSDHTHSCSKCNGQPGCPNMAHQVDYG